MQGCAVRLQIAYHFPAFVTSQASLRRHNVVGVRVRQASPPRLSTLPTTPLGLPVYLSTCLPVIIINRMTGARSKLSCPQARRPGALAHIP